MSMTLNSNIILAAIDGLQAKRDGIDHQIAELRRMLSPAPQKKAPAAAPLKRKRKMSAAGRKAIGDAARRRWAAVNAAKEAGAADAKPARKKRSA